MNENHLYIISKAMAKPVFSLALSGHMLGIMKERLMEEANFTSFPVLALVGAPQTGKTAVFHAAIPENADRMSAFQGFRAIHQFAASEKANYILVDDVSETSNYNKRQSYSRIMDEICRASFGGNICIVGMTIEENTLRYFTKSMLQRMLIADTNDFWNRENQNFTKELVKCRKTLSETISAFRDWFSLQRTSFDEKLHAYEKLHEEMMEPNSRQVYITFAYRISLEYYFRFLKEYNPVVYNNLGISVEDTLDSLVEPYFSKPKNAKERRVDLLLRCFQKVLASKTKFIQKPQPNEELCEEYAFGKCMECWSVWGVNFDSCENWGRKWIKNCYNPADLVIRENMYGLFLEDASLVPKFPKYMKGERKFPLLLINKDVLLEMINRSLEKICQLERKQAYPFHCKEMVDCLYHLNMLMFLPAATHNRYSISHFGENQREAVESVSVLMIRLTPEMAETLDKNTCSFHTEVCKQEYAKSMAKVLFRYWPSLTVSVGKVGEYYGA